MCSVGMVDTCREAIIDLVPYDAVPFYLGGSLAARVEFTGVFGTWSVDGVAFKGRFLGKEWLGSRKLCVFSFK